MLSGVAVINHVIRSIHPYCYQLSGVVVVTIIKLPGAVVINYVLRSNGDQFCYQE